MKGQKELINSRQSPKELRIKIESNNGLPMDFTNGCTLWLDEVDGDMWWGSSPYGVDTGGSKIDDWVNAIINWVTYWNDDRTETGELINKKDIGIA